MVLLSAVAIATGAVRRRRVLVVTAFVLAAASGASVVAGLMYSAGIYARFGIQEAIGVRLALLMLVVAVLDTVVERARERPLRSNVDLVAAGAQSHDRDQGR
jgi:hypothetical protein